MLSLPPAHKVALDSLLASSDNQPSRLTWIFQPPGKINGKNVLQHLDRLSSIKSLALPDGIERVVHQNRLQLYCCQPPTAMLELWRNNPLSNPATGCSIGIKLAEA